MQRSFHMSFANVQRQVHTTMHTPRKSAKPHTEDELALNVIRTMDEAEEHGVDLARAILRQLEARQPKRRRASARN